MGPGEHNRLLSVCPVRLQSEAVRGIRHHADVNISDYIQPRHAGGVAKSSNPLSK